MENPEVDALLATNIVKSYFESVYGNIGMLLFKVESVNPNTQENVWKVVCSLFTSLGSGKRTKYLVSVNIATHKIMDVTTLADESI